MKIIIEAKRYCDEESDTSIVFKEYIEDEEYISMEIDEESCITSSHTMYIYKKELKKVLKALLEEDS